LTFTPVRELESLRSHSYRLGSPSLAPGAKNPLAQVQGELLEMRAVLKPGQASNIVFTVRGVPVIYDVKNQELEVARHRAPAPLHNGSLDLIVYCDRTGLEVFASRGLCYVPMPVQPKPEDLSLSVEVQGGMVAFKSLEVHELQSAWTLRKSGAPTTPAPPASPTRP
jgi:sucrose-6-phosphate hydrolase SacC (GH32 family)